MAQVPAFFRRKPEVVPAGFLEGEVAGAAARPGWLSDGPDRGRIRRLGLRRRGARRGAADCAGELGDKVVVVFGYAPPGLWGGEIAEHEEAIEELGEKVMAQAKAEPLRSGVEIEAQLVPKRAAEALIEAADERDARMIVVGSFGDPPLKGMILGSTPNKLLHLSERPILVVPAQS